MEVRRIRTMEAADALRDEWDALAGDYPFRGWRWLRSWWDAYGDGREPYVLSVREAGGRLCGILPLYRRYSLAEGWCLELMGSGKACSDDMSVLVSPENRRPVGEALGRWLALATPAEDRWDTLDFEGVPEGDEALGHVAGALRAGGVLLTSKAALACWRIDLPDSWEEYLASLSKRCRKLIKRAAQRLDAAGGDARYRIAESADQVARYYDLISQMHQRRWDQAGIAGCFASQGFERLLRGAVGRHFEAGTLHVAVAELDGEVVAGSIGFVLGETHSVYLAGMNPDRSDERPGWLLNAGHLMTAFGRGHRRLDFLRGDEAYKARLGAVPRGQVRLRGAAPRVLDRWRHRVWCAQAYLRDLPGRTSPGVGLPGVGLPPAGVGGVSAGAG